MRDQLKYVWNSIFLSVFLWTSHSLPLTLILAVLQLVLGVNKLCVSIKLCVIAGEDFFGGRLSFFLSPGATQRCSNIVIINDNALEENEVFSVVLATVFFPVPIDVSTAAVTIVDTDCE